MRQTNPHLQARRAETLELINAEITSSLARQKASSDRIDTKSVSLVGYAGAASTFLATRHFQPVLGGIAFGAFAAAAVAGMLAYSIGMYQDVPEPRQLFTRYRSGPKTTALAALAATRVQAFESNGRKHARKARRWWISLFFLGAGMTLMILALTTAYL